jgi:hypothetical protein
MSAFIAEEFLDELSGGPGNLPGDDPFHRNQSHQPFAVFLRDLHDFPPFSMKKDEDEE